jgi:TatD DNase family protein
VIFDSHAHVHDRQFDGDRDAVVERAHAAGVETILTVGCDMDDSRRALDAANRYAGIYASVGIHPHEAKDAPADIAAAFAPLLAAERAIAIGETGLDYYYDHSPRDAQARVLREQLRLARERDLPVIFHQRDAYDDFLAILRTDFAPGMRGVIHCFTGDADQARTYVDEFDLKLGIGGVATFKTAEGLREAIRAVGLHHLILETDCPYLAPVPRRGRRNEPAFIVHSAETVAHVLGVSRASVDEETTKTARALFTPKA